MSGESSPSTESNSPVTLTDADFDSVMTKNPSLIVDCWAPWCGPCRAIAPTIDELAKSYSGKITFGKVNVDDSPKVAQKFGIMSIPTILFIKNGQLVEQLVGVVPKKTIEEKLQKLL